MTEETKRTAGRPWKYSPEILEQTQQYIKTYKSKSQIPSQIGLALHLNVSRKTIENWVKDEDKEEFAFLVDKIGALQHEELMNNGLTGEFNAAIVKLALGKHGYTDRQDVTSEDKAIAVAPSVIRIVGPDE